MTAKEIRINEIMDEQKVVHDVAEQLFLDELENLYPDIEAKDSDIMEQLYEIDNQQES